MTTPCGDMQAPLHTRRPSTPDAPPHTAGTHCSGMTTPRRCAQPQPSSPGNACSPRSHLSPRLVTHSTWPSPRWRNSRYAWRCGSVGKGAARGGELVRVCACGVGTESKSVHVER
eukprot:134415-Chlamydomonas_euryale.AAC.1